MAYVPETESVITCGETQFFVYQAVSAQEWKDNASQHAIRECAYSPILETIVVVAGPEVSMWNSSSGALLRVVCPFGQDVDVAAVALGEEGRAAYVASATCDALVMNVATGSVVRSMRLVSDADGDEVHSLACIEGGRCIVLFTSGCSFVYNFAGKRRYRADLSLWRSATDAISIGAFSHASHLFCTAMPLEVWRIDRRSLYMSLDSLELPPHRSECVMREGAQEGQTPESLGDFHHVRKAVFMDLHSMLLIVTGDRVIFISLIQMEVVLHWIPEMKVTDMIYSGPSDLVVIVFRERTVVVLEARSLFEYTGVNLEELGKGGRGDVRAELQRVMRAQNQQVIQEEHRTSVMGSRKMGGVESLRRVRDTESKVGLGGGGGRGAKREERRLSQAMPQAGRMKRSGSVMLHSLVSRLNTVFHFVLPPGQTVTCLFIMGPGCCSGGGDIRRGGGLV